MEGSETRCQTHEVLDATQSLHDLLSDTASRHHHIPLSLPTLAAARTVVVVVPPWLASHVPHGKAMHAVLLDYAYRNGTYQPRSRVPAFQQCDLLEDGSKTMLRTAAQVVHRTVSSPDGL